jgi:hypothetical protein
MNYIGWLMSPGEGLRYFFSIDLDEPYLQLQG